MFLEQEIKFPVSDFLQIRQKLQGVAAKPVKTVFEVNHIFDTSERSLGQAGVLLRLRQDGATLLTLKRKPVAASSGQFKVREEIETVVESFSATKSILEGLGFISVFQYEKLRETCMLNGCWICLDILPFGHFLEIEGESEGIMNCLMALGLDIARGSVKSYYDLNQEYRQGHGLPKNESFVFTPKEKAQLMGMVHAF